MPGCADPAGYRAPRSRQTLNQYFWFCLEHVRGSLDEEQVLDPLGLLRGSADARVRAKTRAREADLRPEALRQPLDTLGLGWPVSLAELKSRYKHLARKNHPDANNGDRAAEERLKTINVAYTALRRHLTEAPQPLAETG